MSRSVESYIRTSVFSTALALAFNFLDFATGVVVVTRERLWSYMKKINVSKTQVALKFQGNKEHRGTYRRSSPLERGGDWFIVRVNGINWSLQKEVCKVKCYATTIELKRLRRSTEVTFTGELGFWLFGLTGVFLLGAWIERVKIEKYKLNQLDI